MAAYYKKIKGKNYDRELIEQAESSVSGRGDGRISLKDARRILKVVKDSNTYTDIEKRTIRFIRDSYRFTGEADAWFRKEIRKWAATKKILPKNKKKKRSVSKKTVKKKAPVKMKRASAKKVSKKGDEGKQIAGEAVASPVTRAQSRQSEPSSGGIVKKILMVLLFLAPVAVLLVIANKNKDLIEGRKRSPGLPVVTVEKNDKKSESKEVHEKTGKVPPQNEEADTVKGTFYIVQPGDELNEISKRFYGNWSGWRMIFKANKDIIKDPDLISPGQRLIIPDKR